MNKCFFITAISFLHPAIGATAAETALLAGVAQTDMTPKPGLRLWGYGDRLGSATGALDPLMAKAVVLKAGEQAVAIVSLDVGRTPPEPLLQKLRKQTADQCGIT